MARVRIGGNFQQLLDNCDEMRQAFEGKRGIRVRVINEVEYFLFVEYGTSKMQARAMVRNSFRPAVDMLDDLWKNYLPFPFTPDDLEILFTQVKDFLIDEILRRTPVVTGKLYMGFDGVVEQY